MNCYVATFYSHYGALSFCKSLGNVGIDAKPSPVPRKLSSSCGVCARFYSDKLSDLSEFYNDELEAIYLSENDVYKLVMEH